MYNVIVCIVGMRRITTPPWILALQYTKGVDKASGMWIRGIGLKIIWELLSGSGWSCVCKGGI